MRALVLAQQLFCALFIITETRLLLQSSVNRSTVTAVLLRAYETKNQRNVSDVLVGFSVLAALVLYRSARMCQLTPAVVSLQTRYRHKQTAGPGACRPPQPQRGGVTVMHTAG